MASTKKLLTEKQQRMIDGIINTGSVTEGCKVSKSSKTYFYKLMNTNQVFRDTFNEYVKAVQDGYKSNLRLSGKKASQVLIDSLEGDNKYKAAKDILTFIMKLDEIAVLSQLEALESKLDTIEKGER